MIDGRGHAVLDVPKQRLARCEPSIAARDPVTALALEMTEEGHDEVRVELLERPCDGERHDGDGRSSGLLHLGFALGSADAVDELSGAIAAAGYRVLEPPHRVGQLGPYQSVVLDPDGNQVKLTV